MKKSQNTIVPNLIEGFLHSHPVPTKQDWRELIETNRSYSDQILDYALAYKQSNAIDERAMDELLDDLLFDATKSKAMALFSANVAPVDSVYTKLSKYKGPAARELAASIGLSKHVSLLNQVIRGEVQAPYALLKRISLKLKVEISAVAQTFSVNFQNQPVAAYKAAGKPALITEQISWSKAVKAAGISGDEAERLIALEKALD